MTFRFRLIRPDDIGQLHRWRNLPHVARWWEPSHPSYDEAAHEYGLYMRPDYGVTAYMIVEAEVDIGYIQKWRVASFPDYQSYVTLEATALGVDIFIGPPDKLHRGIGTVALRAFVAAHVFDDPAVSACIIDPLPDNHAAIRAYAKVGFRHLRTFTHDGVGVYLMRLPRPGLGASG